MRTIERILPSAALIVIVGLVVFLLVLTFILPDTGVWLDSLNRAVAIGSLVILGFKTAYDSYEQFYLRVQSLRMWATNETTTWNLSVELLGVKNKEPIRAARETIKERHPNSAIWHSDEESIIANMPGYTLRIIKAETHPLMVEEGLEEYSFLVRIVVSDLMLPYRIFRRRIPEDVIPLLEKLCKALEPETEKYVAKIQFSEANPYFGFFVRKLELPKVVSFNCRLLEGNAADNEQAISVHKDRIDIVTSSLVALHTLSQKYITLSVPD